ncbi:MAG TPA: tetratricopeptide repeat protein [Allosphingosinicella sp.]|nr:tetratricopeptide repeat protein [Allosphingosinicella sp.]
MSALGRKRALLHRHRRSCGDALERPQWVESSHAVSRLIRDQRASNVCVMKSLAKAVLAIALQIGTAVGGCEPPETKDRLSPEALERLVEEPIAELRANGLRAGQAKFEQVRRVTEAQHGSASIRVADLLTAFGVQLYMEYVGSEDRAVLQASREYLQAAIPAYRASFGADHPEVAVALHSFADVEVVVSNNRLTPQAEAALEEALRIRRAALGPQNHETLATEERLASLRAEVGTKGLSPTSAARALEEGEGRTLR